MTYTLDQVVPWGRSLEEYRRMFALADSEIECDLLGCADGPASFNCELTERGARVVSCDPIYQFSADEIRQRIRESAAQITEYARQNAKEFIWSPKIPDADALASHRLETMDLFLDDFATGREQGRYVTADLPELPFTAGQFHLCVCSHFLFLYSEQLTADFHTHSIRELMRVAEEVRIFPLLELGGRPSRHLEPVTHQLKADGLQISVERVDYEFQRGANQMMRIRNQRQPETTRQR